MTVWGGVASGRLGFGLQRLPRSLGSLAMTKGEGVVLSGLAALREMNRCLSSFIGGSGKRLRSVAEAQVEEIATVAGLPRNDKKGYGGSLAKTKGGSMSLPVRPRWNSALPRRWRWASAWGVGRSSVGLIWVNSFCIRIFVVGFTE